MVAKQNAAVKIYKKTAYVKEIYLRVFHHFAALVSVSALAAETGKFYVSSSLGNDSNSGSISSPLKTFAKIPRESAEIYLKRGDVFTEPLHNIKTA